MTIEERFWAKVDKTACKRFLRKRHYYEHEKSLVT